MMILIKFEEKYANSNDIHMLPYNAYWATTHFKRPEEVFFFTINIIITRLILLLFIINMNED